MEGEAKSFCFGFSWADEVEGEEQEEEQRQGKASGKANPFGAARPREIVLQEKGVDWRKLDQELYSSSNIKKERKRKENIPATKAASNEELFCKTPTCILSKNEAYNNCLHTKKQKQNTDSLAPPLRHPPKNIAALMERIHKDSTKSNLSDASWDERGHQMSLCSHPSFEFMRHCSVEAAHTAINHSYSNQWMDRGHQMIFQDNGAFRARKNSGFEYERGRLVQKPKDGRRRHALVDLNVVERACHQKSTYRNSKEYYYDRIEEENERKRSRSHVHQAGIIGPPPPMETTEWEYDYSNCSGFRSSAAEGTEFGGRIAASFEDNHRRRGRCRGNVLKK